MRRIISMAILMSMTASGQAAVKGEPVEYTSGETTLKGYLASDDALTGERPGVLVVHEWWGHNEYARKRADMLARLGYTALAVDMYGDGKVAGHPDDAGKFAGEVAKNMPAARARFEAALELLKAHPTTDADRMAAIGYCFGGGVVLEMARAGVDLDGVVSFHGSLATETPAAPGEVTASVLVCHGADDKFVSPEQFEAFKKEMQDADVDCDVIVYKGARHSFTNPDADEVAEEFELPLAYSAEADRASWKDMKDFLESIFSDE